MTNFHARLFAIRKVPSWYEYIAEFLNTQQFPPHMDKNERYKVRVNSSHFLIILDKLYRRGAFAYYGALLLGSAFQYFLVFLVYFW